MRQAPQEQAAGRVAPPLAIIEVASRLEKVGERGARRVVVVSPAALRRDQAARAVKVRSDASGLAARGYRSGAIELPAREP